MSLRFVCGFCFVGSTGFSREVVATYYINLIECPFKHINRFITILGSVWSLESSF